MGVSSSKKQDPVDFIHNSVNREALNTQTPRLGSSNQAFSYLHLAFRGAPLATPRFDHRKVGTDSGNGGQWEFALTAL